MMQLVTVLNIRVVADRALVTGALFLCWRGTL
jgi:hypothetical protein